MLICFKLNLRPSATTPYSSTSEQFYARVINLTPKIAEKLLAPGWFTYCWEDGWSCGVDVSLVDAGEARKIRKKSNGFCGYDWMIDSLITDGRIITPTERAEEWMRQAK